MSYDLLALQNVVNKADANEEISRDEFSAAYAALIRLNVARRNPVVQIDPMESECLEIRLLEDPPEAVVLRHGMSFPEGGLAVYSELLDPDI